MQGTRTAIGSLVVLSLLALPATTFGQEAEQPPVDSNLPVYVTWEGAFGYSFPIDVPDEVHAWGERTGVGVHVILKASDPRVSGEQVWASVHDSSTTEDPDGPGRSTTLTRIENEAGAWQGPITEVTLADYLTVQYGWLTGEGTYDGLSFFYSYHDDTASDVRNGQGVIWPGPPPPIPVAPLLDADPLD